MIMKDGEMEKLYKARSLTARARVPSHPGLLLEELIARTEKSKAEISRLLGISRQQLHAILTEEKPVSANMAVRIGKLFGDGPGIWLRMQANYDAWHAAKAVDVSRIPTLETA